MTIGPDEFFVKWNVFLPLEKEILLFRTPPYDIMIGNDGNQISHDAWYELNDVDKEDSIYRTVAVNKARKMLGKSSLRELRYEKNTVNVSVGSSAQKYQFTNSDKTAFPDEGSPKIQLLGGKRYTFSFPESHPLRFSTKPDGRDGGPDLKFPFSDGVTVEGNTITIDVHNFTAINESLYYYCDSHPGMGGEIELLAPYTPFAPEKTDRFDGEDYYEAEDEFQVGYPIYDFNLFDPIVTNDLLIDMVSLGSDETTTTIINQLKFIPKQTDGATAFDSVNLAAFKQACKNGTIFVDMEDSIDSYGNRLEEDPYEILADTDQEEDIVSMATCDAHGPGAFPSDLPDDLKPSAALARTEWFRQLCAEKKQLRGIFQPETVKDIALGKPKHAESTDVVPQKFIQQVQYNHAVLELSCKFTPLQGYFNSSSGVTPDKENYVAGSDYHTQNGVFFDDIFTMLNIKDPGYGIKADGTGGQDLSSMQRTRRAKVINDEGIISFYKDAVFSVGDQPRGSIYLGGCLIPTPNGYLPDTYDEDPRFLPFWFGDGVGNPAVNLNLAYRIFNDFTRLEAADDEAIDVTVPLASITIDQVKALGSLVWSEEKTLPEHISVDHFSLRHVNGAFKGPAIVNSNESSELSKLTLQKPTYKEVTISANSHFSLGLGEDITRTYWVLDPKWVLNISQFDQRNNKLAILDEYGFDLNQEQGRGPGAMKNVFLFEGPYVSEGVIVNDNTTLPNQWA